MASFAATNCLIADSLLQADPDCKSTAIALFSVPMGRPSFEMIYMSLASELARRSTCLRLNVGTVITSTDYRKVLAVGYNGNASGLANTCDREEPGNCRCLHSEENAVINCDSHRSVEKHVF